MLCYECGGIDHKRSDHREKTKNVEKKEKDEKIEKVEKKQEKKSELEKEEKKDIVKEKIVKDKKEIKKGNLCPHMFKCLNCKGEH